MAATNPYGLANYGYSSPANYTGGIQALLTNRPKFSIDFLATARGQQMADDVGWQNRTRDIANQKFQDYERERNINRAVVDYLAPLQANFQTALAAGRSPSEFLQEQMAQMMAQPQFNQLDPIVQSRIIGGLTNQAKLEVNNLLRTGQTDAAAKLAQSFGISGLVPQNAAVMQAGDALDMIATVAPGATIDREAGTVTVNGQTMPASFAATYILKSNGNASGLLFAAEDWRKQQDIKAQRDALLSTTTKTGTDATNATADVGAKVFGDKPADQKAGQPATGAARDIGYAFYNADMPLAEAQATMDQMMRLRDEIDESLNPVSLRGSFANAPFISGTHIAGQEQEAFYNRDLATALSKLSDKEISGLRANLTARIEELARILQAQKQTQKVPTTDYTAIIQQLIGGKR